MCEKMSVSFVCAFVAGVFALVSVSENVSGRGEG